MTKWWITGGVIAVILIVVFTVRYRFEHIEILDGPGMVYTGYSLEELEEKALKYYEEKTGYKPGCVAASPDENDEDMVNIQLYDSFEDHNSTCDWYAIDKYSGKGTNVLGEEIDLTEV